jgi:hypothetical protein
MDVRLHCTLAFVGVLALWVAEVETVVEEMTLGWDMGVMRVAWVEHSLESCYVGTGQMVGSSLQLLEADLCYVQGGAEMEV